MRSVDETPIPFGPVRLQVWAHVRTCDPRRTAAEIDSRPAGEEWRKKNPVGSDEIPSPDWVNLSFMDLAAGCVAVNVSARGIGPGLTSGALAWLPIGEVASL